MRLEASASGLLESVAGSRSHDHGGHLSSDHRGSVPVDVAVHVSGGASAAVVRGVGRMPLSRAGRAASAFQAPSL